MNGKSNIPAAELKPGAKCIVFVDAVNYPTGIWEAVTVAAVQYDNYTGVQVKLTDPEVRNEYPDFQGDEPYQNYTVLRDNEESRFWLPTVKHLNKTLNNERRERRIEKCLYDHIIKMLCQGSMDQKNINDEVNKVADKILAVTEKASV